MKRLTPNSDHQADGNHGKVDGQTTVPFAENRYGKYRFERESIVTRAPESSGVYGLYSALWIFIGEAENIKARLLEHLAGDNPCISHHQPSGFAFELVSSKDRSRRRIELINELEPRCKGEPSHFASASDASVGVGPPSPEASALNSEAKVGREIDE
jgi:hypothetical protein